MKNYGALVVGLILFIYPFAGVAYDQDRAQANLASELADCAAYYTISAEGARRTGNVEMATAVDAVALAAITAASRYSREEVAMARMELSFKEQIETIDRDFANLALLIARYAELCKEILEDPGKRLNYWVEKE